MNTAATTRCTMSHDGTVLGMEAEIKRLRGLVGELTDALDRSLSDPDHSFDCDARDGPCCCHIKDGWDLVKRVRWGAP